MSRSEETEDGREAVAEHSFGAQLHPLLVHHILNTLEWPALRPLQKSAIQPILEGNHLLLTAPTAGGKTEAAVFPLLSRMLTEDWEPLSVLYLCPLRALLNNLHPRIDGYAGLVGRRAGLWHGDVPEGGREKIRDEPPDLLLTTPESIEAMLISRKTDHRRLFRNLRAVVVDEIHAFAGDDRGWHLLAVTERVQRLADRPLQRVGLSATVGNPTAMVEWLSRTSPGNRVAISPPVETAAQAPEVSLDYVGSIENAATIISRLHRGEKRLVFVDSRARVEELAVNLRDRNVETFVSHGSLGREARRAAEEAFASSRDCVIVATSTLELGIDVGDLDRVIQIDASPSVAAFLQRLGRTGRRACRRSNTLFLVTRDDAFLQTLGLLHCWESGFVEPLEPEPLPLHLAVQQLLALVLQEGGVGRHTWAEWLGRPFILGEDVGRYVEDLTSSLIERGFLFEDSGILGLGQETEDTFGRRHFLDLMAVFSEPPMLKVLAGRTEIGQVPIRLLTLERPDSHLLLLSGRDWTVKDVDWRRRVVQVEPTHERGKPRWFGDGQGLSFEICQGMKQVLAGKDHQRVQLSGRGQERLQRMRGRFSWVSEEEETFFIRGADEAPVWWTFAGMEANIWLAIALADLKEQVTPGDLSIRLVEHAEPEAISAALQDLEPEALQLGAQAARGAIDRLKFSEALPAAYAQLVVEQRMRADEVVREVGGWRVRGVGVPLRPSG